MCAAMVGFGVLGLFLLEGACGTGHCLALCAGRVRISLSQTVTQSERFSVEVNGKAQPLSYSDPPPSGLGEDRANQIVFDNHDKGDNLRVRWLVDGSLWFEQTLRPTWTSHEVCGQTCWSADATLELPETLPDGAPLTSLAPPCSAGACMDR